MSVTNLLARVWPYEVTDPPGWLSELHCEALQRLFRNCCDRDCAMRDWQSSWNPELTKRDVNRSSFPTAGEGTAVARPHRDTSGLAEVTANNYRFRKSQTETFPLETTRVRFARSCRITAMSASLPNFRDL
jgi:hypothetical protein